MKIEAHDLDLVANQSDEKERAKNSIYDIDTEMQLNYSKLKTELISRLEPVIVVQSDTQGGTFTLINNGIQETVQPVSDIFKLVKSVSHIPLGIYSIIAPYLKDSKADGWITPLTDFNFTMKVALENMDENVLPKEASEACTKVLNEGMQFIEKVVENRTFSITEFTDFTTKIAADIETNMQFAAQAQVDGVTNLLSRWKESMGAEDWSNLYTIVLAIWTTEIKNQNWVILNQLMDQNKVSSNLITIGIGSFNDNTIAVALDNLARIIQDNIAAEMIFPTNNVLAVALKGQEDLLSTAIESILSGCPHQKK